MIYFSIDIETTGLYPENCQILEFGAVMEDTEKNLPLDELPRFHRYITHDQIKGDPYAIMMNAEIIKRIALKEEGYRYITSNELGMQFSDWVLDVSDLQKISVAGKNFGSFDNLFLKQTPFYIYNKLHHRFIDPGSMWFDPTIDTEVPSLDTCLERAGITKFVEHTAIADSIDVIQVIRAKHGNKTTRTEN